MDPFSYVLHLKNFQSLGKQVDKAVSSVYFVSTRLDTSLISLSRQLFIYLQIYSLCVQDTVDVRAGFTGAPSNHW